MIPEDAVADYLSTHGWPDAEATMTGIRGTGRVLWHCPGPATAERSGDGLIGDWLDEVQDAADLAGAALGVLVTPREDYGAARVASWWAHLDVPGLARLMSAGMPVPDVAQAAPVRMHLSTATVLLRAAGLGVPLVVGQ
ncbi:hypothetical protein ACF07Q_28720 [Nocardiopsis dassonvillei]|uniref:hypothetical protein n=1 Tax=Nocardiopsis dassonvillei TaxID=2014 RepID=UPI0036F722A7